MSAEEGVKTKKAENFGEWYLEVIAKSDVVDERVPIKGVNILMPTGMEMWHSMMDRLDEMLKGIGVQNYNFPLFIPEKLLKREAAHFKGFIPEVAWVTHAGKTKLSEKMAVRPTSEIIMYEMFKLWIRSYKDLPLKVNQYVNIVRWDTKMTKPLIRDREFLWHETHSAHSTEKEADDEVKIALNIYRRLINETLGLEYLELDRPEWDRFPGAEMSVALDAVMPDGKILQLGTVHNLGQKFSQAVGIKFIDKDGEKRLPYQLSYGVSTRLIGAVVGIHGDDKGLIIPPAVAPVQIVIVPVYNNENRVKVMQKCGEVLGRLEEKEFRVHLDSREQHTPGYKYHEWELKGVPVRIEIGPRDIEKGQVTLVRRDFLERIAVPEDKLEEQLLEVMDSIGFQLQKRSKELLKVSDAKDLKDIKAKVKEGGFLRIDFCMGEKCAKKLKTQTQLSVRGTLFGKNEKAGKTCAVCGKAAKAKVYLAHAY